MQKIKLENFKSGKYKINNVNTEYSYKSFIPILINTKWVWENSEIDLMLSKASRLLGEFNAFSYFIPDIDKFIEMHIAKEANTSSKIEGTKTEFDELFMKEENIDPEKRDDWKEVKRYIKAMHYAIDKLETIPLSSRLLKGTHKVLMSGVRGDKKMPGEFRKSQNWIGGANLQTAYYIPPVHTEVGNLITDMEKFLHNKLTNVPSLIKIAISHYQFETIHPFLDGNGRVGRLLITLYLVSEGLLNKPSLYLSSYFEKNRMSYYDALNAVRINNDMTRWIKFFLNGIIEITNQGIETFQKILKLKKEIDVKILKSGKKAPNLELLMDYLYKNPIINASEIRDGLNIALATANSLIDTLCKFDILVETTGNKRHRSFAFKKYLDLFNK